ncbi:MAG: glycosyltransferase family protein [Planctomycetota bacterium]|jgi:hypothetical protein
MNVLLAARTHAGIGGSQSWNWTVRRELERRGHHVDAWDYLRLQKPGLGEPCDLAIVQHAQLWSGNSWNCPTINVCHGIIDMERPEPGFDHYVYVSEEARSHWGTGLHIIRQPIDLDFWSPCTPESAEPTIYRHSHYGGMEWLPGLASDMGFRFTHGTNLPPLDARAAIRQASVVVSSGRGALEAMACGVPTIIADDRPYGSDHAMMCVDCHGMRTSYSGRGGVPATRESMKREIEIRFGEPIDWRSGVAELHDASMIVDQLLELAGGSQH